MGRVRRRNQNRASTRRRCVPATAAHSQDSALAPAQSHAAVLDVLVGIKAVFRDAPQSSHGISGRQAAGESTLPLEQPTARTARLSFDPVAGGYGLRLVEAAAGRGVWRRLRQFFSP